MSDLCFYWLIVVDVIVESDDVCLFVFDVLVVLCDVFVYWLG